jgi:hypothetical protein
MKTYWGVEVYVHAFLTLLIERVSSQLHAPAALPPRKQDNIKIHYLRKNPLKVWANFKPLGTTITNRYCVHVLVEFKSRLNSRNACCHSVQTHFSFRLFSKRLKIKIYKTIVLPVVFWVSNLVTRIKGRT